MGKTPQKSGKTPQKSTGITPMTMRMRSCNINSPDENKENIPPGTVLEYGRQGKGAPTTPGRARRSLAFGASKQPLQQRSVKRTIDSEDSADEDWHETKSKTAASKGRTPNKMASSSRAAITRRSPTKTPPKTTTRTPSRGSATRSTTAATPTKTTNKSRTPSRSSHNACRSPDKITTPAKSPCRPTRAAKTEAAIRNRSMSSHTAWRSPDKITTPAKSPGRPTRTAKTEAAFRINAYPLGPTSVESPPILLPERRTPSRTRAGKRQCDTRDSPDDDVSPPKQHTGERGVRARSRCASRSREVSIAPAQPRSVKKVLLFDDDGDFGDQAAEIMKRIIMNSPLKDEEKEEGKRTTRTSDRTNKGDKNMEEEKDEEEEEERRTTRTSDRTNKGDKNIEEEKDEEEEEQPENLNIPGVTPIRALRLTVRLNRANANDCRVRTMETPQTPGKERRVARVVQQKKDTRSRKHSDGSYESSDISDSSESEENNEEVEEEESGWRKSTRRKSTGTPNKRKSTRGAQRAVTRTGAVLQFDDDEIDAQKAPSTLTAALERLSTTRCPRGVLLCREKECADIREFIRSATRPNGVSQACYISGVPGTGKTASVQAMVNEAFTSKSHLRFVFIHVNAMYFTDAKQLFSEVWSSYCEQTDTGDGRRVGGAAARRRLNAMFETVDRQRPPVLILVDELDQLSTRKQELIYDIFNWTAHEAARVSVVAIANTLDLPERMLNQRICSRLGMNRVVFQPYTHDEIIHIVQAKLGGAYAGGEGSAVIEKEAVELAARKVAAITGDLRKAFDILRAAVDLAMTKGEEKLTMSHVHESIRTASSTLLVHAVDSLPTHHLILFSAAVEIVRTQDVEDFSLALLLQRYNAECMNQYGRTPVNEDALWRGTLHLAGSALLSFVNPAEARFRRRIKLVPPVHDALSALKIAVTRHKEKEEKQGIPIHERQFV